MIFTLSTKAATVLVALLVSTAYAQTNQPATAPAVLLKVAACESGMRQYDADGNVIVSPTADYGLFQINASWIASSSANGYDIMTPEGNTAWALHLYQMNRLRDWSASKSCWDKAT